MNEMMKRKVNEKRNRHFRQGVRPWKKTAAFLLAGVLFCLASVTALAAADTPSIDWTKDGESSITVTLIDGSGETISGGELALYQVASLMLDDGSMTYVYTDDFQNCGVDLDGLVQAASADASDLAVSASALAAYAESAGLSGTELVNENGTVTFTGLEFGLYLVVQTHAADDYTTLDPFVVSLPLADEEADAWVYEVDASPKMGTVTYEEPEEPDEPEEPEEPVEPEEPILPQTGQLNWPIPLLCVAGVIYIVCGIVLVAGDNRRKRTHAA